MPELRSDDVPRKTVILVMSMKVTQLAMDSGQLVSPPLFFYGHCRPSGHFRTH